MLSKKIQELLRKKLEFNPTPAQEKLIPFISEFIINPSERRVLIIKGFAGTGKTSMIKAIVKSLSEFSINSFLLAPTGRAAKVISKISGSNAYTIHKKIYRQRQTSNPFGKFELDFNKHKDSVFIVDESSMINDSAINNSIFGTGNLLDDLLQYVYSGRDNKLILIGDSAQLPPVGMNLSPALDRKNLEKYGFQAKDYFLKDIVRQAANSGILYNATVLREILSKRDIDLPKLKTKEFDDIERVSGEDLIEKIDDAYSKYGMDEVLIVCRSNNRAYKYNMGIRNSILYREEEISAGDNIMVVKNNYLWADDTKEIDFIANGDIAEIIRISKYEELYDFKFAELDLRFIDYADTEISAKVILNSLHSESAALSADDYKKLFDNVAEDYIDIRNKRKRFLKLRENPYLNALQIKFAYAATCHKAQGGQWDCVFVDQGYIPDDKPDKDYIRWLYTAFTRAVKKISLVNFKDDFFDDGEIE